MNFPRFFRLALVAWSRSLRFRWASARAGAIAGAAPPAPAPAGNPRHPPRTVNQPNSAAARTAGHSAAPASPPRRPRRSDRRPVRRANHADAENGHRHEGHANWDSAFDTLIASFKALSTLLDKQGIKPTGNPMIVYTSTDDTGFTFLAEIPVDQEPKNLTKAMSMGKSPDGKALKFVHRGSYDNMDNTYEAITNHLDDKKLEAKDTFIEEYITDPLKTAEDKLVINVYVPLK